MRVLALAGSLALMGLAGCSSRPESYASMTSGVGFGDYQRYLRDRESSAAPYSVAPETRQAAILPPATMPATPPSTLASVPLRSLPAAPMTAPMTAPLAAPGAIATQTLAPVQPAPMPAPVGAPLAAPMQLAARQPAPLPAPQPTPQPASLTAASLASPATTAAQAAQSAILDAQTYRPDARSAASTAPGPRPAEIVTVTSVPPPSDRSTPNVVAYALSTSHAPGTEVHRRINPMRWSRWENACLQYRNQDAAQEAFLASGGPERDRDNLDPDGDGYACWWDPTPMRQAALARR